MSTKLMINQHIQAVLDKMGFTDDAFVPIANDRNRQLMQRMQQLISEKSTKSNLNEQLKDRVKWLKEHFQNAQVDIQQNMKLIDAHRCQLDTESHMCKVADNERSALAKEIKETVKKTDELKQRDDFIQNEVDKLTAKMDNLGSEISWIKNALIEWKEAMKSGEDATALIEKYCKQDERYANELEVKLTSLQSNILREKAMISDLWEEQRSVELVLDRTATLYRQTHAERQQLVQTWREAVASLASREEAINEVIEQIEQARLLTTQKHHELNEQMDFLNQQIANNKESEYANQELNKRTAAARSRLIECNDSLQLKSNELAVIRKSLKNLVNALQQTRQKNRQAARDCEKKSKIIENLKVVEDQLKEKLKKLGDKNSTAQDRLRHFNELAEEEEKSLADISLEMDRLGGVLYRSQQLLQQWQQEQKLVETEIQVLETAIKAISSGFIKQEREIDRHTEIMYDVKFKELMLDSRIAKMRGEASEVNPEVVEKLSNLEKIYAIVQAKHEQIRSQVAEVEAKHRKLGAQLEKDSTEHADITDYLNDRLLYCDMSAKKLHVARQEKQERLVEHSLLKMRVHHMQMTFQKQMNRVYSLEQHKFELQLAIDERMIDINCQLDLLNLKKKHLIDEQGQLRADINERQLKIEALRKRYELARELLGKNDDGSIISAVQLKIATAQEKEILFQKGGELNEKVVKAERDIKALENTLILLNYSNEKYKNKLGNIQVDGEANEALNELNKEYTESMVKLKNAKATFSMQQKSINEIDQKIKHFHDQLEVLTNDRLENNDRLMKVHKDILDQKSKVERAERELKTARKSMIQKIGDREYIRIFEKSLNAKELEQKNTAALQQLADMVDSVIGMGPIVSKYLYERGIEIRDFTVPVKSTSPYGAMSSSSRNRSRTSFYGSIRDSDASLTIRDEAEREVISRLSGRSLSMSSSTLSNRSVSMKSEKSNTTKLNGNRPSQSPTVVTIGFPSGADDSAAKTKNKKNNKE